MNALALQLTPKEWTGFRMTYEGKKSIQGKENTASEQKKHESARGVSRTSIVLEFKM